MWVTLVPTLFFVCVLCYGIYLGVSGKQDFTFENKSSQSQSE